MTYRMHCTMTTLPIITAIMTTVCLCVTSL